MPEAAIQLNNVHKRFGDFTALRGVDFSIRRGEFFGLLGPNGAGKSTLIHTIAGLTHVSEGSISVLGHDVMTDYRRARRCLGVVPQELVYDPFFPIRDLLRLQAGYYGCGRAYWPWIDELLVNLDLDDKRGNTMRELSGGMKRRVLIAQALVHKPDVVILDEPTAGVDVELRRTLWRFTRQLHAAGHTIVLTTHYLEEAEQLCERIAILNHGQLRVLEDKQALLQRRPYRFLRLRLDRHDGLPEWVEALVCQRHNGEMTLRLMEGEHHVADVLEAIRGAGIRIEDVHTDEPSLEDIFIELTSDAHDQSVEAA